MNQMLQQNQPRLTGSQIRTLMRRHGKTIRGLAISMQISMKRVREVRQHGVAGELSVWEWTHWATTPARAAA